LFNIILLFYIFSFSSQKQSLGQEAVVVKQPADPRAQLLKRRGSIFAMHIATGVVVLEALGDVGDDLG
jgi:hypothetical protein